MKITIKNDFRRLKQGDVYEFEKDLGYTLVAGANGYGKSSLFHALRGLQNDLEEKSLYKDGFIKLSENIYVEHEFEKIFFLDSIMDDGNNLMISYDAVNFMESGGFATKDKSHDEGLFIRIKIKNINVNQYSDMNYLLNTIKEMKKINYNQTNQ